MSADTWSDAELILIESLSSLNDSTGQPVETFTDGKHIDERGYVRMTGKYAHPNASKRGVIFEHTFVMSTHIGRELMPGESVHHKNGDRADNRIENLELWNRSQPYGQRVEDKVNWAIQILKQYSPGILKE